MIDIDIKDFENKIFETINNINNLKPFDKYQLLNLKKWFKIWFTSHSNAIEWNSFNINEVKILIEDWITVWWKTIKELKETQNLANIVENIWDHINNKNIDENLILNLHKDLLSWIIDKEYLWKYRATNIFVTWEEKIFPSPNDINEFMKKFFEYINWENKNILYLIARSHYDFVKIHPFIDWNWRIARLIMNILFIKNWFMPIIIPVISRNDYISSFNSKKQFEDFYKFFLWQTYENQKDYLRFFKNC